MNPEYIQVTLRPADKAFVKSQQVTITAEINGKRYEIQKIIPDNFLFAKFDQMIAELVKAVKAASKGEMTETPVQ